MATPVQVRQNVYADSWLMTYDTTLKDGPNNNGFFMRFFLGLEDNGF